MAKKLFAVGCSYFGNSTLERVSVSSCAGCGKLLYRSKSLGQREFYWLDKSQVRLSTQTDARWSKPIIYLAATWARKNLKPVEADWIRQGWDEVGAPHDYCGVCADEIIKVKCQRCGKEFDRKRSLPGGWACDDCFTAHCTAMCSIKPGEAVAALLSDTSTTKQENARDLYALAFEAAEKGIEPVDLGLSLPERVTELRRKIKVKVVEEE